jgi:hypothetical protein
MDYEKKAFVIHNSGGRIIHLGRVPVGTRGKVDIRPGNPEHTVIQVQLDAEQAAMTVAELHRTHKVHVSTKKLVRR